jgi:hypothetical protein
VRRRRLLGGLAGGATGLLAGCVIGYTPTSPGNDEGEEPAGRERAGDLPLPESDFRRASPRDAIPAIVDPVFASDWRDVAIDFGDGRTYCPRLATDDLILGVERDAVRESATGGQEAQPPARAYPLRLLNWHEVVNDTYGGPILVTYCPLCRSGLVARRRVREEVTTFGVTGLLLNENLVLYDAVTDSRWSQIRAEAVRGPMTGTPLEVLPSSLTTWGDWRADHPETDVLLPPPRSGTVVGEVRLDYSFDLAGQQREAEAYLEERIGDNHDDSRLAKRALVLGVATADERVAYPVSEVAARGPAEDRVGELPVVVAGNAGSAVAYDRRVAGETLSFAPVEGDPSVLRAGGSRWAVGSGRALDGPHEGTRLAQANRSPPMFFFAWLAFHPETRVWGRERST